MSLTKEQGWDIFAAEWDHLVTTTNKADVTEQEIEDAYKAFDDKLMDTLPQVIANHPGNPPPRRRPS